MSDSWSAPSVFDSGTDCLIEPFYQIINLIDSLVPYYLVSVASEEPTSCTRMLPPGLKTNLEKETVNFGLDP